MTDEFIKSEAEKAAAQYVKASTYVFTDKQWKQLCYSDFKAGFLAGASLGSDQLKDLHQQLSSLKNENKEDWMDNFLNSVPDLSGESDEIKNEFVRSVMETVSKPLLATYVMLGLKTHMIAGVVNEVNNELYEISFKKLPAESIISKGEEWIDVESRTFITTMELKMFVNLHKIEKIISVVRDGSGMYILLYKPHPKEKK